MTVFLNKEGLTYTLQKLNNNIISTTKAAVDKNEFYSNYTLPHINFKKNAQNYGAGIFAIIPMFKLNLENFEDVKSKITISCGYKFKASTQMSEYSGKQSGTSSFTFYKSGNDGDRSDGFSVMTNTKFNSLLTADSKSFYVVMRKNSLKSEYEFYMLVVDVVKYSSSSVTVKSTSSRVFWHVIQNDSSIPANINVSFEKIEMDPIIQPESLLGISSAFKNFYTTNNYDANYLYTSMEFSSSNPYYLVV